jgi:hypothetical protein
MRGVIAGVRRFVLVGAMVAGLGAGGLAAVPVSPAHAATVSAVPVVQSADSGTITLKLDSKVPSSLTVGVPSPNLELTAIDSTPDPGLSFSMTGQPPGISVSTKCGIPSAQACNFYTGGTPTQPGTFTAVVTATDSSGASASVSIPLTVDDVVIANPVTTFATIGQPVNVPFTAYSAANDPLDFTVGSLPAGISYATTGPDQITFTGIPTTAGSPVTNITVTNPLGGSTTSKVEWIIHGTITVKQQANLTSYVGGAAAVSVSATDSVKGAQLDYSASGLPPGIYQGSVPDATVFSGWPAKVGTYHVTINIGDNYQASASETFTWTVKDSASSEAYGPIRLDLGGKCLDDGTGVRIWNCNGTGSQNWTIAQDGTIRGRGECLTESGTKIGSKVVLAKCTDATSQQWQAQEESVQSQQGWAGPALVNVASGLCLGDPGGNHNGVTVEVLACNVGASKTWTTPAGPIENGIPGMCLADPGNATANGTRIVLWQCNGWHEEDWTFEPDGTVRIHGKCLYVDPNSQANGDYARLETCNAQNMGDEWADYGASPFGGTIYNLRNGNDLATAGSSAANGTPVGTYIYELQLSVSWRPL